MSDTLLGLAADYDRRASRCLWQQTRDDCRNTSSLFRRMVCNRQAADPAQLTITMSTLLDIPDRWCRQHGYRAIAGIGGFVIQRDDETPLVAGIGDTLAWDGRALTVRPA
ncbi:hypothetical protein ACF061_00735 [Streptomyces sp. NPDC015220]|uniref:hypothetical protein n=1 Tax=Streptomyces sp. NPDC015220 TaxID=3364947 RepID=UPI0036F91D6F